MKNTLLLLALLMLPCSTMFAQQDSIPSRKKVGVVLSGGGAKGMAHIGVLKVLERAGIPVDIIDVALKLSCKAYGYDTEHLGYGSHEFLRGLFRLEVGIALFF